MLRAILGRYDTCRLTSVRLFRSPRSGKRTIELSGHASNWNAITPALWEEAVVAGAFEDLVSAPSRTERIQLKLRFPAGRLRLYQELNGGGSFVPVRDGIPPQRLRALMQRRVEESGFRLKALHIDNPVLATAALDVLTTAKCPSREEVGELLQTLQRGLIDAPRDSLIDGLYVTLRKPSGVVLARFGAATRLSIAFSWHPPPRIRCGFG